MMDNTEITIQELKKWRPDEYHLVDVRDEMSYSYGHLPGAEHIPEQQILDGWVPDRIQPAGWLSGVAHEHDG